MKKPYLWRGVSVSGYKRVVIYGKSNAGGGSANVSFSIKDQNGAQFQGGTLYTGKPDANYHAMKYGNKY